MTQNVTLAPISTVTTLDPVTSPLVYDNRIIPGTQVGCKLMNSKQNPSFTGKLLSPQALWGPRHSPTLSRARPPGLTHSGAWEQLEGFTETAILLLLPIPSPLPQVNEI